MIVLSECFALFLTLCTHALLLWSSPPRSPADGGCVECVFAVRVIISFNSAVKRFGSLSPALEFCYHLDI